MGVLAFFSSIRLETIGARTVEYVEQCHLNHLVYEILTNTDIEYHSLFIHFKRREIVN